MQSTRPVRQRASSSPGFGSMLYISSWLGVTVIACSRSIVRWSISPVTGMPRLAWKPRTASTVAGS